MVKNIKNKTTTLKIVFMIEGLRKSLIKQLNKQ